jgi:hypothetical protein
MSITGYSRLNSLTVEVQRGGMEGFLVDCRPIPAAVALSCFFLAAVDGASVPKNSVTGHVRYNVICTSSTNVDTVVYSIEQGRGSPSSHFSCVEEFPGILVSYRRLVMRDRVTWDSRLRSWRSSLSLNCRTQCKW